MQSTPPSDRMLAQTVVIAAILSAMDAAIHDSVSRFVHEFPWIVGACMMADWLDRTVVVWMKRWWRECR